MSSNLGLRESEREEIETSYLHDWSNQKSATERAHHGSNDGPVSVDQSRLLAEKLGDLDGPDFAYYEYAGGGHNPNTLRGSATRITPDGSNTVNKDAEDRIHELLCSFAL